MNRRGFIGKLVLIGLLAGMVYCGLNFHVVKVADGVRFYKKEGPSVKDSYLDVTKITLGQLKEHKEVVIQMVRNGDQNYLPAGELLGELVKMGLDVSDFLDKIDNDLKLTDSLNELKRIAAQKLSAVQKLEKDAKESLKKSANQFNDWLKTNK